MAHSLLRFPSTACGGLPNVLQITCEQKFKGGVLKGPNVYHSGYGFVHLVPICTFEVLIPLCIGVLIVYIFAYIFDHFS